MNNRSLILSKYFEFILSQAWRNTSCKLVGYYTHVKNTTANFTLFMNEIQSQISQCWAGVFTIELWSTVRLFFTDQQPFVQIMNTSWLRWPSNLSSRYLSTRHSSRTRLIVPCLVRQSIISSPCEYNRLLQGITGVRSPDSFVRRLRSTGGHAADWRNAPRNPLRNGTVICTSLFTNQVAK